MPLNRSTVALNWDNWVKPPLYHIWLSGISVIAPMEFALIPVDAITGITSLVT